MEQSSGPRIVGSEETPRIICLVQPSTMQESFGDPASELCLKLLRAMHSNRSTFNTRALIGSLAAMLVESSKPEPVVVFFPSVKPRAGLPSLSFSLSWIAERQVDKTTSGY